MMKIKLILAGIVLLALLLAALYLRYGGVTNETVCRVVVDESGDIKARIDARYQALDQKLNRIEGKLDRLLELADRPLPDNLKPIQ